MAHKANNGEAIPIADVKHAKARRLLPDLCSEYRRIAEEAAAIDAAKRALMTDIKTLAKSARIKKVEGDGWMLVKADGRSPKVNKEKLLKKGVSMEVIESCTDENAYTYFQVRAVREET